MTEALLIVEHTLSLRLKTPYVHCNISQYLSDLSCRQSIVSWTQDGVEHYCGVIMGAMASQIKLFAESFIQTQIKENIKVPRHWPLWGEFTGDQWIPRTKGQ